MASSPLREMTFDPLVGSRAIIRGLREATARPGVAVDMAIPELTVRPTRLRPACAVLLAVLGRDVSLAVVGSDAATVGEYLRFNTGARCAPVVAADFILVTRGGTWPMAMPAERRERWRTVVLAPDGLGVAAGAPTSLILVGTGDRDTRRLAVGGITVDEFTVIRAENAHAPSIDVWLVGADDRLAVLPATASWTSLPVLAAVKS